MSGVKLANERSMNTCTVSLRGANLVARPSGALYWPDQRLLCVSDLHLGKSERIARRSGAMLPPYETQDTLERFEFEINYLQPQIVVCLGDSFDDLRAGFALAAPVRNWLARLQEGRDWVWIEGNHDPAPLDLGGRTLAAMHVGPLVFRHMASAETSEISGHYHPKAVLNLGGRRVSRPCFLADQNRIILPAFGTYTGGLHVSDPALRAILAPDAVAILTGTQAHAVPMVSRRTAR